MESPVIHSSTHRVLVVANPGEWDVLRDALSAPLPNGVVEVVVGDGGDDTISTCRDVVPEVAVVAASLDVGDARALLAAMSAVASATRVVLIGDHVGPIRTALDASDFGADRFITRPLNAKALRFAVASCIDAGPRSGVPVAPEPVRTEARVRWEALDVADPVDSAGDSVGDRFDVSDASVHEPWSPNSTAAVVSARAGGAGNVADVLDVTERWEDQGWTPVAGVRAVAENAEASSEPVRNASGDAGRESDRHGDWPLDTPPPDEARLPEGTFGRSLRAKMSAMADRMFRTADGDGGRVEVGVRHSHRTEIDLAALANEPQTPAGSAGHVETSAPRRMPSMADEPAGTQVRGRAEVGEIVRGSTDAAGLIARAMVSNLSGTIVFRRGDVVKTVTFERGRPVFVTSNQTHDRMGELLYREGKITDDQLARCQEDVSASGRRTGEILVDMGCLKRRELLPAVRRHLEDLLYSLFAWTSGQYRWTVGEPGGNEKIRLARHPASFVFEGIRRKFSATELDRLVGSGAAILELAPKERIDPILQSADLSAEERAFIDALDGRSDIIAATEIAEVPEVLGQQLGWAMVVLGVATLRRDDTDVADEPHMVGDSDISIDRARVMARWRLVAEADYFALLGVRRDATTFEIKRAYESTRKDFSSDSFPAALRRELGRELEEISTVLDESYRVLSNDSMRAAYLRYLRDPR